MPSRPRVYKTEGIILRRRNIGEADSIFTVFSPTQGKFDAVAKGVRKARSHMRGHLEPLTRCRLMVAHGRSLDVLTQAETVASCLGIRDDLDRLATGLYAAELIDRFLGEREAAPEPYALLSALLDGLNEGLTVDLARWFEVQLLACTGYEIQAERCAVCSRQLAPEPTLFCPSAGGLACGDCRGGVGPGRLISVRAIKVLRFARSASLDEFAQVHLGDELASELRAALADVVREIVETETRAGRFLGELAALPPTPAAHDSNRAAHEVSG
jgi:DNA repair protein RecO (recombination protein O)